MRESSMGVTTDSTGSVRTSAQCVTARALTRALRGVRRQYCEEYKSAARETQHHGAKSGVQDKRPASWGIQVIDFSLESPCHADSARRRPLRNYGKTHRKPWRRPEMAATICLFFGLGWGEGRGATCASPRSATPCSAGCGAVRLHPARRRREPPPGAGRTPAASSSRRTSLA